jgi:apolipoprotein N-acyltransferase
MTALRSANPVQRLAAGIAGATGWRRAGLGVGLGVLAAAAMPPVFALPLLWIAFPGLVWLTDGARDVRGAFLAGWYFGVGFFAAGLYWISYALLVDPERYGWLVPFAIAGLGAGLGIFTGIATLLVRLAGARGVGRVLVLAASWTLLEWLRGWILTGFPWNLIGSVWAFDAGPLQLAAVAGVYGITLITVLAAAMPAVLADQGPRRTRIVLLALLLPALSWFGGQARLTILGPAADADGPVKLAIVQPNIPQSLKWDSGLAAQHLTRLISLSGQAAREGATHIVWPESAVPYSIGQGDAGLRQALGSAIPPGGALLTGATRIERGREDLRAWNSLVALDGAGRVVAAYDKFHLVPFGEYMPFRGFLPFDKLAVGPVDFSAGPGPRTLAIPGLPPVSPLICYEAIFPGEVADESHRPSWLLNVTNDAWFGISSGPYQHFASARIRTVEEGLPLVRAANTGISGVVDAYGRVIARLGLGEEGVIEASLPASGGVTPFARWGNGAALLCVLACFLAGLRWRGKASGPG